MGSPTDHFPAATETDYPQSRPYVQSGNAQFLTTILNNAEQSHAFAQAHLDQLKASIVQFRQMIGQ
jgi:hypothetical protein